MALAVTAVLWSVGRVAKAAPLWIAFIGAETMSWSLKVLIDRARPPFIDGLTAASPSFPSAHAAVAVSVYGALAVMIAAAAHSRSRTVVYGAAVAVIGLIAFSRLILSLHYLSDVAGGLLVGALWVCVAFYVTRPGVWKRAGSF